MCPTRRFLYLFKHNLSSGECKGHDPDVVDNGGLHRGSVLWDEAAVVIDRQTDKLMNGTPLSSLEKVSVSSLQLFLETKVSLQLTSHELHYHFLSQETHFLLLLELEPGAFLGHWSHFHFLWSKSSSETSSPVQSTILHDMDAVKRNTGMNKSEPEVETFKTAFWSK